MLPLHHPLYRKEKTMAGPQFIQDHMGALFYNSQVPRVISALERIGTELKRYNDNQDSTEKADAPAVEEPLTGERKPWEYKIYGQFYEKLRCPNGTCRHEFLIKMADLEAGVAGWVYCPLCKNHVEVHLIDPLEED